MFHSLLRAISQTHPSSRVECIVAMTLLYWLILFAVGGATSTSYITYPQICCSHPQRYQIQYARHLIKLDEGLYKGIIYEMFNDKWTQMIANSKFKDMPDFGKARKGHISLQDHGDPVWYRNVKIKELQVISCSLSEKFTIFSSQ